MSKVNIHQYIRKGITAFAAFVLIASASIGLSSCGDDNASPKTLYLLSSSKNVHLDPATSQGLNITNLSLIARRLTSWNVPKDGSQVTVEPDIAQSLGEVSDGGKTITYHLKSGIKFETGDVITSYDIKWGLERSYADELTGGLSLHKNLLVGGSDYTGPFGGKELDSIETPDDTTIIFHLERPFADWDWIASTPAFSPVPNGTTDISDYDHKPVASGAYKVKEYEAGVKLVFDKNPNWDKSTDPFRSGDADEIVTYLGQSADTATDRLIADQGDDQYAFASSFVAAQKLAQIQSQPDVAKRLVTSDAGAIKYLALNNSRPYLNDKAVRIALQYAVDKNAVRLASGGEIAGEFASTLITPGIKGRVDYDLYPTDPSGDVEKAKQLLIDAGVDASKITLKLVAGSSALSAAEAQAIQQGIERVGIKVTIAQLDSDALFDLMTSGEGADYDIVVTSWQPDIPTPDSNIEPLYASDQIGHGNFNLSQYSSPDVDAKIKAAQSELNSDKADELWQELDKEILQDAPIVPLFYTKNSWLIGSKVENFYIGSYPAYPNYLQITVTN